MGGIGWWFYAGFVNVFFFFVFFLEGVLEKVEGTDLDASAL